MSVKVVSEIEFDELERRIRDIPLVQKGDDGSEIYAYRDANISFRRLHAHEVT